MAEAEKQRQRHEPRSCEREALLAIRAIAQDHKELAQRYMADSEALHDTKQAVQKVQ